MADEFERQRIFIAVKGVVMNGGKALILCRSGIRLPDGREWWEFPGGTLEFGEPPEQTVVRELREETGLDVEPERLLYASSVMNDKQYQIVIITYLCRCSDFSRLHISHEHLAFQWADRRELQRKLADDIASALDQNGLWTLFDEGNDDI